MVFKFQKIIFLEFRVAQVSKKRPASVRGFKNTGTVGQISGRVWTRPSPSAILQYCMHSIEFTIKSHSIHVKKAIFSPISERNITKTARALWGFMYVKSA